MVTHLTSYDIYFDSPLICQIFINILAVFLVLKICQKGNGIKRNDIMGQKFLGFEFSIIQFEIFV